MELPNPNDPTTTYIEKAWKGEFGVDEATYNGSIITLKCLDDMVQFDRPYSHSTLVYPATLGEIVRDACAVCLGSASDLGTQQFPHYTYSIPNRPDDEKLTFREVISWCAAIAGCFARMAFYPTASASKLEIKWFNQDVFEQRRQGTDGGVFDTNSTSRYTTGDTLDGGTFNPWNTGDVADAGSFQDERPFHHITSLYQHNISVDDVVITGVRTTVKDDDTDSSRETITALTGTEGYVIDIANNDFITKTNATEIRTWLGQQLIGLKFRKATVTHPSDPSIEAGDIAFVYDRKGVEYPILVTRTVFQAFGMQTTTSGADTPNRNSATRYSQITKSYVENRKMIKHSQNPYAKALQDLASAVNSATGMYETDVTESGATIHYRHNKPNLEQSDIVIKESSVGITFTTTYLEPNPVWYGFTVDGDIVANLISALGINFEWAVGTTLTLGGANNGNGVLRVLDANGNQIGIWDRRGIRLSYSTLEMLLGSVTYVDFEGNTKTQSGLELNVVDSDREIIRVIDTYTDRVYFKEIPSNINLYGSDYYLTGMDIREFNVSPDSTYAQNRKRFIAREILNQDCIGWNIYQSQQSNVSLSGTFAVSIYGLFYNCFRYNLPPSGYKPCLGIRAGNIYISGGTINNDAPYPVIDIASPQNGVRRAYINVSQTCFFSLFDTSGSGCKIQATTNEYISFNSTDGFKYDGNTVQTTSSSKRYKHDITENICDELNPHRLYELKMKQFVYNDDHKPPYECMRGKTISGFIAEDIKEIYPAAVIETNGVVESWSEAQIIPPMLALIQEQKKQLDEQQQKIESLEDRIEKLEKLVEKLL